MIEPPSSGELDYECKRIVHLTTRIANSSHGCLVTYVEVRSAENKVVSRHDRGLNPVNLAVSKLDENRMLLRQAQKLTSELSGGLKL